MYENMTKNEIKKMISEIENEISERKQIHNKEIENKEVNYAEQDYDDDMSALFTKLETLKSLLKS